MKKLFLLLVVMTGTLAAYADEFPYLTFETTDGTKVSVTASSLTISISETTLTAGGKSFTLSDLSKMYFSTTDESTTSCETAKGDVNGDGEVTITDAVVIVNMILGNETGNANETAGFNATAADVNGDKAITITDAVGVVNIILSGGSSSDAPAIELDSLTLIHKNK